MHVHKPLRLGLSTRGIEHRRRRGLAITAFAYCSFADATNGDLWSEPAMWNFLATRLAVPRIDDGIGKTHAEFMVNGFAFAPQPQARRCAVSAAVGSVVKQLVVTGDRAWQRDGTASEPAPFDWMPLDWTRSFGGDGFDRNPIGCGRADGALPNFEYANDPCVTRGRAIAPAGFGPIDADWEPRRSMRGTYDEQWLMRDSPGFAADLDWTFFNVAPTDQQLPQGLVGDEPFEFANLHPTRPRLSGRLPGIRARCLIGRRGRIDGALEDVAMTLTTAWFFPDAERAVLVFHGLVALDEDDASDIELLVGAAEAIGQPRPIEHYATVVRRRAGALTGGIWSLRDADLLPRSYASDDPLAEAVERDYKVGDHRKAAMERRVDHQVEQLRARAIASGRDPDALGIKAPAPAQPIDMDALAEQVEQHFADQQRTRIAAIDETLGRSLQQLQAMAPAQRKALLDAQSGPPKPIDIDARLALAPPSSDLPKLRAQLQVAESQRRSAYVKGAHEQWPAPPKAPDQAAKIRRALESALRVSRSMVGIDLTGADLSGMDLSNVDFTLASMESVDLRGANLSNSTLTFAVLASARLQGVMADGADFTGANLGRADLSDASLRRCRFNEPVVERTRFDGADLSGSMMSGLLFSKTTFSERTCFDGSIGERLKFIDSDLKGASCRHVRWLAALWSKCRLEQCDFTGADLGETTFVALRAAAATFAQARLAQSVFVDGCDLQGCDFTGADLAGVNLRGAGLRAARFDAARLDGADLSGTDLREASLVAASAKGALLIAAKMTLVHGERVNLRDAILQRADLRSADLTHGNLFGADLSRAQVDAGTLLGGTLATRARTHPRALA